jgi:hypothetical protein
VRPGPATFDPFRCYLGRKLLLEDRPHVVECHELHGRNLLFRLREVGSDHERRISLLELLDLLESDGP